MSGKNDGDARDPKEKEVEGAVMVTLTMPDGRSHDVELAPKVFSSGREGFYAHIPPLVYDNDVYGGQVQIWNKSKAPVKRKPPAQKE